MYDIIPRTDGAQIIGGSVFVVSPGVPRGSSERSVMKLMYPLFAKTFLWEVRCYICENNPPHRSALIYLAAASQHGARAAAMD